MNAITKHVPNTITCLNLLAGCLACVAAFKGSFSLAAYFVILAAIFDFMDGFAARLFKAYSPMGKELDSLADMVSFGVAPSIVIYTFLVPFFSVNSSLFNFSIIAFLLAIFSALRLAKFNIDERQTTSFLGLPTPANAIFWVFAVKLLHKYIVVNKTIPLSYNELILVFAVLIVVFSLLLVSEIPMFSLKFKNYRLKENALRYFFLLTSLVLLIFFRSAAFPFIIVLYISLSLLNWGYQIIYVNPRKTV